MGDVPLTAEGAKRRSRFSLYRKTARTLISDTTFPPGTVYATPEGLRAEDEETRAALDVQGGIYPIRESVFRQSYVLDAASPSSDPDLRALRCWCGNDMAWHESPRDHPFGPLSEVATWVVRAYAALATASPSNGPDHEKAALAAFDETMKAVEPWASGPVRSKHRAAFVRNLRAASPSPPELEESTWRSGPSPARRRHG